MPRHAKTCRNSSVMHHKTKKSFGAKICMYENQSSAALVHHETKISVGSRGKRGGGGGGG